MMIKKRKKILVVDDSETVRAQLGQVLRDAGYEVLEAADGLLGAFTIRETGGDIALVICDINMPRFDGIEMLEILHGQLATLPVLMLTSESRIDKIERAGAAAWMLKPFKPNASLEAVAMTA